MIWIPCTSQNDTTPLHNTYDAMLSSCPWAIIGNDLAYNGLSKEMSVAVKGRLSPSSWLITQLI